MQETPRCGLSGIHTMTDLETSVRKPGPPGTNAGRPKKNTSLIGRKLARQPARMCHQPLTVALAAIARVRR
jgi:hypothetical protein